MNTALSFDEVPRGTGETGATIRIARALDACGIDAPASLYDEALALAREGRLTPAAERLRMILCLDPNDAEAALMLGKVLLGREQWQEALSWLDVASANGAVLPPGLREEAEHELRRDITDAEEQRQRLAARERGEVRNLRAEAKRLRSVQAALEIEVEELRRRVRMWSGATAIVAGAATALLLASLLFGGGDAVAEDQDLVEVDATAPAEVLPAAAAPAAVAPPAVAAPAVAAPAAAEPAAKVSMHTVRKGENLGSIAKKYYGSSADWPRIQAANADTLGKGTSLQVGMKLKVPAR